MDPEDTHAGSRTAGRARGSIPGISGNGGPHATLVGEGIDGAHGTASCHNEALTMLSPESLSPRAIGSVI